jgi:predicted NBD/HSP70 family sugar kinase
VRIGNMAFQRNGNLALVLQTLRENPGLTRTQLAERLRFDRSTITNITAELIHAALIREDEYGSAGPRGGRRPVRLKIEDHRICAIGFEIEPYSWRAVVLDNAGAVIKRSNGSFRRRPSPDELIAISRSVITEQLERGIPITGAGYGIPGSVDPHGGRIIRSRSLSIENEELIPSVSVTLNSGEGLEIPIAVDNDANCCAWGELHRRRGTSTIDDLLVVLARRTEHHVGIGLGLILDGIVQYGGNVANGEFYTSDWCGDDLSQTSMTATELVATQLDDKLRRRFIQELLSNLTPIISMLNPEAVLFAGELRERFEEIHEELRVSANLRYLRSRIPASTFDKTSFEDDEVAAGAASMVLERLFEVPRFEKEPGAFTISWDRVLPILEHMRVPIL